MFSASELIKQPSVVKVLVMLLCGVKSGQYCVSVLTV